MSETTKEHRDCLAKGFPFWNDLTPDEQDMLCRYTRPVHYAKGARVHSPLESCVGILLLRSGQLRAYLLSEDGRDVTLYRLFGGEQADAAERACALLRLPDDGGALFRQHVDHAAGAVHERRPQACHFSHR